MIGEVTLVMLEIGEVKLVMLEIGEVKLVMQSLKQKKSYNIYNKNPKHDESLITKKFKEYNGELSEINTSIIREQKVLKDKIDDSESS